MNDIEPITAFYMALDALKLVDRRSYIAGGERLENSAEHSWHLAMACWNFACRFYPEADQERLIKLALIHDLGEIGAGDTFLYDAARANAHVEERKGVEELARMPGNSIEDMLSLWDEQEYGDSLEVRILKVMDRLLPFMLNLKSEGRAWRDAGIRKSQVLAMHEKIAALDARVYAWIMAQVDVAVANGWLIDA